MDRLEERYCNDAVFHRVVCMLEAVIADAQLTPAEIREAAMLACIHYEMRNARKIMMEK